MPAKFSTIFYMLNGRRYLMPVYSAKDLAALHTFADHMATLTPAATVKITHAQIERIGTAEQTTQDVTGSVDYYCDVLLRCGRKRRGVPYPAPKWADLEQVTVRRRVCYRLKAAIGKQIAQWYSTLSGDTYEFVSGYVCGPAAQKTG